MADERIKHIKSANETFRNMKQDSITNMWVDAHIHPNGKLPTTSASKCLDFYLVKVSKSHRNV